MDYDEVVANLSIRGANYMTPKGRGYIADWLRHCAESLLNEGKNYGPLFSAKYIVPRKK